MKPQWPTLEGRLSQPLTSEKEALIQLQKVSPGIMTEYALKKLEKYLEQDEKLQQAAKKVQAAVDASPKSVTLEEAKKQVESFKPV